MSVNNLRNYNWEQGTQASPVLLTGAEFNKLTALIEESNRVGSNINADIRGWVQVGQNITSYQKYLAELAKDGQGNPLLHVVNTQIDPVSYTVIPQSNSIKEGNSTKLNINGISLSALKFRIINHTVQSLDYQARTTIDTQLGYVKVAPAQENATWTDVITIQCCPIWEEWTDPTASIIEFDITVNAISVSSVTIMAPQYVKPTETFYPIVNFFPSNHTKPIVNTLEDAGAKRGICFIPTSDDFSVGKTTDPTKMSAIAPSIETPIGDTWSLGCGVYAFTNEQTMATPSVNVTVKYAYIQFTVTTDGTFSDISSANPKITLQKVDSEDTPIGEPVLLTGTVSGSSLIYTYGNGNVAGDGSEIYKCTFDPAPTGYRNIDDITVIPNQVVTEVSAQYVVDRPDIYQVYSDSYEPLQNVIDRGGFIQGKTRVGIAIITPNVRFILAIRDGENISGSIAHDSVTRNTTPRTITSSQLVAIEDSDGDTNSQAYLTDFTNNPGTGNTPAFVTVMGKTITYKGTTYNGHLLSFGELKLLYDNFTLINNVIKNYYQMASNYWYPGGNSGNKTISSTGYNATNFWTVKVSGTWENTGNGSQSDTNFLYTAYKITSL